MDDFVGVDQAGTDGNGRQADAQHNQLMTSQAHRLRFRLGSGLERQDTWVSDKHGKNRLCSIFESAPNPKQVTARACKDGCPANKPS